MGSAMAKNLLRAGVPLTAWNRTRSKAEALTADGAILAASPAAAVAALPIGASLRVLFINVSDTPDVESVLFGEQGVTIATAEQLSGLIVVDHSTICPIVTKQFAERLLEQGVTLIDAPVSGGDVGAQTGTLSIMCGGDPKAFEQVKPLLKIVGESITHLGPAGSGQACKACNQAAVVATLAGVCEALALAKQSGLDLKQVIGVLSGGAAASWQLANLGPKIAAGDHAPGFLINLLLKDLNLVASAAQEHDLPMPVTQLIESLFQSVAANGAGEQGTQALATEYQRLGKFCFTE